MKTGKKYVDAYIQDASPKARPMLRQIRRAIITAAPKATEGISYGMPYYSYFGRLTYFAAFRDHVSLFAWGRPVKPFAKAMKKYKSGASTLRFPLGTKVPVALVKKLVKARAKANEASHK